MRIALAFRAFFAALAGKRLPLAVIPLELIPSASEAGPETQGYLPEGTAPSSEAPTELDAFRRSTDASPRAAGDATQAAPETPAQSQLAEAAAVQTLGLFQSEGRLLDFLSEDIAEYADADVGQVVREIHRGCKKALEDHFSLEPVRPEAEEGTVTVGADFDPSEIRLVGNVVGEPPFSGTLKHAGYRAKQVRLPRLRSGPSAFVVMPAEVEV